MARIVDLDKENIIQDESVIGLGNFDGIHLGHRDIIKNTIRIAKEKNLLSSVLVFKQHTNEVFPHFPRFYISSLEDKIEILSDMGVDIIYIIDFTKEFAKLNKEEFIFDFIKDRLNASTLVCGRDYTFGKVKDANVSHILEFKEQGKIDAFIVDDFTCKNHKISSTMIRRLITEGDVSTAAKLLGMKYTVKGEVVHGYKIGSKELGYPTANIKLSFNYLLPKEGVYLTNIYLRGKKYLSLTSIGTNPTVTDNGEIKFEVYIIDFDKSIYGDSVRVEFIDWIRNQIKFNSKDELIEEMNKDLEYARKYEQYLN